MNKKLNALLEDGKVYIAESLTESFLKELNKREIPYYCFPMGNESMIELIIEEEN